MATSSWIDLDTQPVDVMSDRRVEGRKPRIFLALFAALAAASLAAWLDDYRLFQLTMVLAYAIALLGLNLLTGYNGQISLGHGAFFALGAYGAAILIESAQLPYWLAVPAAGLVCLVAGFLFGLPALRLEGLYLALATFALGVAMPQVLKYKAIAPWTGGSQGVTIIQPEAPWGLPLSADQWLYLFVLAWALLLFWMAGHLVAGRVGRAMVAIREQPIAATAMGIDTSAVKAMTFGVSAALTGVGGALGAIAVQFVAPDSFSMFLSISLLVGVVVGGLGSRWGPLFGAFFIQFVPNFTEHISKAAPWAVYGVLLILCMYVMPAGIAGGLIRLACALQRREPASNPKETP